VLCEVKTINVSDVEARQRYSGGVGTLTDQLEASFFAKLSSKLAEALTQIKAFDADPTVIKIVYVVINFDDALHEYADRYGQRIERYIADCPTPGLEVVLYWMPPFGSAAI
jgi:hypothetical protein